MPSGRAHQPVEGTTASPIMMLLPLFVILTSNLQFVFAEPYELRIYEGATAGSKMTMSESLERRLMDFRDCFGQLETNVSWVDFNLEKWLFETRTDVVVSTEDMLRGTLRLLCAANKMHSIGFRIQVTRRNRHPPLFSQAEYRFYLPTTLQKQMPIGSVTVIDRDPVIYNSRVQLSVLNEGAEALFDLHQNGTLILTGDASSLPIFKPLRYTLLAVDFGSPQLFALANVTVIPVSVSEAREISVNVATSKYQIFEWKDPEYGTADKFIVSVSRNDAFLYQREVDRSSNIAFFKIPLELGTGYALLVTAVDVDGETPSKPLPFSVISSELTCEGDCSKGGTPICYHGGFEKVVQYRDNEGTHCSCYDGYSGNDCSGKEHCPIETTVDAFGHVDWEALPVNETASIPCPFGAQGNFLKRMCMWDVSRSAAVWRQISSDESCRKQSSVLIHLGVIGNYARDANSISGIETVYRFIGSLLKVPAFQPNVTNVHFDVRIAEHVIQVFDAIITRDWQQIKGDTTDIQVKMLSLIDDFSRRLPVPYKLASVHYGVAMQTLHRLPDQRAFRSLISPECGVRLPAATRSTRLRAVCMRNSTLHPVIDNANPLVSIEDDIIDGDHQQIQLELRPFTEVINFTCVRYDEKTNGWTTSDMEVISYSKDGFIVCSSGHSGLFSLLPRSMFAENHGLLEDVSASLPALTAVLTIVSCLFLHLVSLFHGRSVEPMLPLLFLLVLLFHVAQLFVLVSPSFIDYVYVYDPHLSLTFNYLVITLAMLVTYISFSVHSKLFALSTDLSSGLHRLVKAVTISLFLIVLPIASTVAAYLFDSSSDRKCALKSSNMMALLTLCVPLCVSALIAFGYCVCIVRQSWAMRRRLQYMGEKDTLSDTLIRISICILVLFVLLLSETFLFVHRTSLANTLLLSACHLLLSLFLSLFFVSFLVLRSYVQTHVSGSGTRSLERKRDLSGGDLLFDAHSKSALPDHLQFVSSSLNSPTSLTNNVSEQQLFTFSEKPMVTIV